MTVSICGASICVAILGGSNLEQQERSFHGRVEVNVSTPGHHEIESGHVQLMSEAGERSFGSNTFKRVSGRPPFNGFVNADVDFHWVATLSDVKANVIKETGRSEKPDEFGVRYCRPPITPGINHGAKMMSRHCFEVDRGIGILK